MNNPIIQRELIGFLRSRWALAIQIVPAVVFAVLVLLRWPDQAQVDLSGVQAQQVFRLFGYGLLTVLLLLVPAVPASGIVREKNQGTLALLLDSPMSSWSIYFGKFFGTLACVFLPLLMSVPAAAACYAMSGLELANDLGRLYAVLAIVTIQYAALGLYVSSYAAKTDAALRVTYAIVLVLAVISLGPYQFLQFSEVSWKLTAAAWLRCLSPIPAVMELMGQGDVAAHGLASRTGNVGGYAILALLMSVFFIIHTALRLKQTMLDRPRPQGVMTEDRVRWQQWGRRFVFLIDPQRRSQPIGSLTNPVLVKEFRTRRFGRSQWMIRLIAFCATVSLLITVAATLGTIQWGVETIGGMMVLLQVGLIVILTPSLAAGSISTERETGGWILLLMTPLSAVRIVTGKLFSVTWTVLLTLLATLPGYAVVMLIKPVLRQQVTYVMICLLLTAAFAVTLSAAVSSFFRRTAPATITAYSLLAIILCGPMLVWLGRDAPFGHAVVEKILIASPLAAALSVMEVRGFSHYDLLPLNWWVIGVASLICLVVLGVQTWRLTRPS